MRRTLYPHPEQEPHDAADTDEGWNLFLPRSPFNAFPTPPGHPRSRLKARFKSSLPPPSSSAASSGTPSSIPQTSKYSDIYSEFVQRYRSGRGVDSNPQDDPDFHFFQRGLDQLADAADSDEEDPAHAALASPGDHVDPSLAPGAEHNHSASIAGQERLDWQTMLASVLGGDVLKSEKTRIDGALDTSIDEQNAIHLNLWLGIRAKLHGRSVEEERRNLEERRLRIVDQIIEEVMNFRVDDCSQTHDPTAALKQVNAILRRVDSAQSLYPTLKSFYLDKSAATDSGFQARCDTLNTWSTVLTSLRHQLALLRRWTGSETLDVTQPNTTAEMPICTHPARSVRNGQMEIADGTTFVERVLKEDSIQRTFEKGFLVTVHAFIGAARDAQVNLSALFREMNLPTFERELVPLISFPTKLVQACLKLRLDYVQKLQDPDVLIIDQMTEDLTLNVGLACTLKRQYEVFLIPDPGGKWNLPQCISGDYDATILEALRIFFRLIHWKLKSGVKAIYFKETDVLEAQWATFNDVSLTAAGGSLLVAEQLCALTNKLMVRVTNYFESQVRVPSDNAKQRRAGREVNGEMSAFESHLTGGSFIHNQMSEEQMISWYSKILDSVRLRYRKLQRFARVLTQRFRNSAEYSLEDVPLDQFIAALVATDHFLVYTQSYEEDGIYLIAPSILRDREPIIRRILTEAFHVSEVVTDDGIRVATTEYVHDDLERDVGAYLLVLAPCSQFLWNGLVLILQLPKIDFDLKDNHVRLIADGPQRRLASAKQCFDDLFVDEEGLPFSPGLQPLVCLTEQQAHIPSVNRELRKFARATNRLAEAIVDSVHHVRSSLETVSGCQELMQNWFLFASEHGQHAQKHMDRVGQHKLNSLLIGLAISWVSFICDDCDPNDRRTFKWAVNALEYTFHCTRRNFILQVPDDQFEMLRSKVSNCMTVLMGHFDILGARDTEAKKRREQLDEASRQQALDNGMNHDQFSGDYPPDQEEALLNLGPYMHTDASTRVYWDKVKRSLDEVEKQRTAVGATQRMLGRVLDDEKLEDRSLVFLANSSSNISIRWQQGRFIGAGAFGSVYLAVNLDSGSLMAVKEIKFQDLSGLPNLYTQIKDELSVMEMLHHPNVVEYYGIEVHRDKVYIFEEYCQGGSLAALLEHGRIEDEGIIQVYTMQMLEGLAYLHSKGIVHRDVKPDNILLDHMGVIKFVDFGAAKILAKNQRSMKRSRRWPGEPSLAGLGGLSLNNSLTGTPMYMSPEIIKNDTSGKLGAMDIWSLGCVVLEFATGKKPWSNLDNEWAIMFHIGVATQHPPLPESGQLSEIGISFIKQCLIINSKQRPSAVELMSHPWILHFREALMSYEEAENANSPRTAEKAAAFDATSVARQAAKLHLKHVEAILSPSPSTSPPSSSPATTP